MTDLNKTSFADTLAAVEALPGPQRERFKRVLRANQERGAAPSMDLKLKDGVLEIILKGDPVLVQALQMANIETADPDFLQGLVGQIACVGSQGKGIDSSDSNFVMPAPDPSGLWIEELENGGLPVMAEQPLWCKQNGSRMARARAVLHNPVRDGWTCHHCTDPISEFRRADARFCCHGCKKRAARARMAAGARMTTVWA